MAVTIKVNGANLSLVHKGSGGIVKSTLPDVCKTPSPGGPIPIPYPVIISRSADLTNGTKTVKVDGGNPAAVKGSQLSRCTGDEPGTVGGVKSGTQLKEATWLSYSFDVMMEGRNACRLSDKLLMNHGNTACLAGILQAPVDVQPELMVICAHICTCDNVPEKSESGISNLKQRCVELALLAEDNALQNQSPLKPEIPYNMTTSPPTPLLHRVNDGSLKPTEYLATRMIQEGLRAAGNNGGIYEVRIPDVIVVDDLSKPMVAGNLKAVVEIKFNNQARDVRQVRDYIRIVGGDRNRMIELDPEECGCGYEDDEKEPALEPVPVPDVIREPKPGILDQEYWEKMTGLTGAALLLYIMISVGSRVLFPPRNLIPVP